MLNKTVAYKENFAHVSSQRIALFSPSLAGGGAERVMAMLAVAMRDRGLNVDLVLVSATGPYLSGIPTGVRVVDLKCRRVLTSLPALIRYLRRERPVALLSTQNHANLVALWAKTLSRVQVRTVIRQASMLGPVAYWARARTEKVIASLLIRISSRADAVVTLNDTMAEEFRELTSLSREKVKVIHNPVPTELILAKATEEVAHPWFDSGEPPVILSVGRMAPEKGFVNLIDAFARVRSQFPAKLMILGDGQMRAELEARVHRYGFHDDVAFPGFEDNPYKYMHRAAVFVMTSRWEGFPNALVEAMACGTRVIATTCPGGTVQILENGRWGTLVPVGDSEALASAIVEAITVSSYPDGRCRARDFSLDAITGQYMQLLGAMQ